MSVSISTSIFCPKRGEALAIGRALEMAAEAGFGMVEVTRHWSDWEAVKSGIADAGLRVWAVHGTLGSGAIAASDDERRATVDAELRRMEEASAYAPCPYVVHYLSRHHDPAVGERFRQSIEALLKRAAALGFVLAIETVPFKPEENERYANSAEVADFVRSLKSENAAICVDLNHSNLFEELPSAIRSCSGQIATIHVSDNHGEREEHLLPGQGTTDFDAASSALREAGYGGAVNLECHTPGSPTLAELKGLRSWAEAMSAILRSN